MESLPEASVCPVCTLPTPGSPSVEPFIQYCVWHQPDKHSPDDWKTGIRTVMPASEGADGDTCRAFAELLRGPAPGRG